MNYPRDLAVRVLTRVLSDHEPLDEALASVFPGLSEPAKGWLQEVCSGTLRWKGRLDLILDQHAIKKKPSGWLRKVLLIGVYQLVAQDRTQPVAVVSETVDEIKRKEGRAPSQFANAILRKIAEHASQWRSLEFPAGGTRSEKAAWASLPDWFWEALVKDYGEEWAVQFANAALSRPTSWIRVKDGAEVPEGAQPDPMLPGAFQWTGTGALRSLTGLVQGTLYVQDRSSQFWVDRVVRTARPGASALDLCAAPGGKSIGMAWGGLQVTSTDLDPRRLEILKDNVARAAPTIRVIPRDQVAPRGESFGVVWVDAPCSGSGILRRHPDVRWLRREKDLQALQKTQRSLLQEAAAFVAPQGLLVYTVCSVLKDEGERLVDSCLEGLSLFEKVESHLLAPQDLSGGDGFWGVLLRRTGS